MRSRAALAGHPLHPAMVAIPVGAFTVALVADAVRLLGGGGEGWAPTARYAIWIGLAGALLAALLGFVDYFTVTMSAAGRRLANIHMVLNLLAVVLYSASCWLRDGGDTPDLAVLLSTVGYLVLAGSGWLGGEMVFKHKIGVIETADAEATALGQREGG